MSSFTASQTSNHLSEYQPYLPMDSLSPVNIASPATAAHNTHRTVTNTHNSYDADSTMYSNNNTDHEITHVSSFKSNEPASPQSPQSAVYFHHGDDDDDTIQVDSTDNVHDQQTSPHQYNTLSTQHVSVSNGQSQPTNNSYTSTTTPPPMSTQTDSDTADQQQQQSHLHHTNNNGAHYNQTATSSSNKASNNAGKHITVQPRNTTSTTQQNMQISRWGEIRPKAKPLTAEQMQQRNIQLLVDREREGKWLVMLNAWSTWQRSKPDKVKQRICKGVPDSLRGVVWTKLSDADEAMKRNSTLYSTHLNAHCEMEDVILRDIHRTFPTNIFYKDTPNSDTESSAVILRGKQGKAALFNVLKAYSTYDRTVGYCQGMGFVTGLLLQYMNEQTTFYVLRQLIQQPYQLSGLYQPSFPLLNQYFYILNALIQQRYSKLHAVLADQMIEPSFYSTQWFITLYSYNFPVEITLRIWDILLGCGTKILFRVALYIIGCVESECLNAEYEQVINTLKNVHTHQCMSNVDQFIAGVLSVKLKRTDIQKLAQEYGNKQLMNKP